LREITDNNGKHVSVLCLLECTLCRYKRNAINNGLVVLEVPKFVDALLGEIRGDGIKTIIPDSRLTLNLEKGELFQCDDAGNALGDAMSFQSFGSVIQELIVVGGLENWIKAQLSK
jgi:homoaconitate hydratase